LGEIFERVIPETPLEWTGERLTTATSGQVEVEHLHRYFLARALCRGLDVLDVASGEGYGTALLAQAARSVIGVEVSTEAVAYAGAAYRGPNLRFLEGDARCLPLDDASVDAVVSFETIEHLYEHDQFLAEVRRVLRPGGRFITSSPERDTYSPSGSSANPYHVRELSRAEFNALLRNSFAHVRLLGQRTMLGSALVSDGDGPCQSLTFEKRGPRHFEAASGLPRPVYLVAVASDQPVADVPDSLYIETAEIGAVLAAAGVAEAATAELTALRARVNALERAQAETHAQAAAQAEAATAELIALRARVNAAEKAQTEMRAQIAAAQADAESARTEIAAARDEATAACSQRDIARVAARRAAAASEGHWHGRMAELEEQAANAERHAAAAEQRAVRAEQQAAEWQHRYEGLHGRLEGLLRRFWILRASRLIPASGRRFVRERLLGWGRR
jgi:ubiquinone/menaquinone biosynthesis C-methylase UbiE